MEMVLIQVSRCFAFAGIHNTRTYINFGIFFFFAILSSTWNGTSFVTYFKKSAPKYANRWYAFVVVIPFLLSKKCHLEFARFFGVFHPMERVLGNLLPRFFLCRYQPFQSNCDCKMFFSFGFTSISLTKCTLLSPFFSIFFYSVSHSILKREKKKFTLTENLMRRTNQIHCVIRLMTCCVHLNELSIVPLTFRRRFCANSYK